MKPIFPAGVKIDIAANSFEMAEASALKWNIETTQLQKGPYRFAMKVAHTPILQLGYSWRSLGTRLGGSVPEGTVVLAFALNSDARLQFRGRKLESCEMIVQEDTQGMDFSFMGEIKILTVAVSREELNRRAISMWGKPFPLQSRTGIIRFSGGRAMDQARNEISGLLACALDEPGILPQPGGAASLENSVLDGLLCKLEDHSKAAGSIDRHRAARRARAILHDRCCEDISISDLCAAVRANRRTLHLGFLELYGLPPMKYLNAVRVCGVRKDILSVRDPDVRITDIATKWGFTHLGRFSSNYRAFFGELPSVQKIL